MPAQPLHTRELFASLDEASSGLLKLVRPLDNDTFNAVPFKDSWTAAQLVVHLIKSNLHIVKSLSLKGKIIERDPAERASELEEIFLNFSTKLQSPEFILPQDLIYSKEEIVKDFIQSMEQLKEKSNHVNFCEAISHRAFGEITKLELLYFVLYHTQRHTHQLKNILTQLFHHKNQQ
jgi:uncharacterized damage-inducible protein DinB